MYLVLLFATTALLGASKSANVNKHMKLLSELDNNINPNLVPSKQSDNRKFLAITKTPQASYVHNPGTMLELTCEAVGMPAPSIHWFKNDAPVYEYDVESNELIDSNPTSLAKVVSTLLVTHTTGPDVYTCLANSGFNTTRATTVVYSRGDDDNVVPERLKLFPLEPRIVVAYRTFVDVIGNNVVLPCRAKGHPRPQVTWTNNRGVLASKDPRMKVLRSGELVITSLRWTDMGEFTCRANNIFGSQLIKTFVYPAKAG